MLATQCADQHHACTGPWALCCAVNVLAPSAGCVDTSTATLLTAALSEPFAAAAAAVSAAPQLSRQHSTGSSTQQAAASHSS
jgi:hypothetical protein